MTSLKTSIKTITYLSDTGCLEIQGASLLRLAGELSIVLVLNDFQPLPIYVFISEQTTRQKIPRYLSESPEQMFLQNPYLQCV
ncbi:hypothetical protein FHR02_26690 [Escherichia coli]|nr:hypothetical protein [Escherichia coli]